MVSALSLSAVFVGVMLVSVPLIHIAVNFAFRLLGY